MWWFIQLPLGFKHLSQLLKYSVIRSVHLNIKTDVQGKMLQIVCPRTSHPLPQSLRIAFTMRFELRSIKKQVKMCYTNCLHLSFGFSEGAVLLLLPTDFYPLLHLTNICLSQVLEMAVLTVFFANSVTTIMFPGRDGVKWCQFF